MKPRYRYRSAIWGHFVSAKWAKDHPRTTVRERIAPRKSHGWPKPKAKNHPPIAHKISLRHKRDGKGWTA